jgi:hypothetical protein
LPACFLLTQENGVVFPFVVTEGFAQKAQEARGLALTASLWGFCSWHAFSVVFLQFEEGSAAIQKSHTNYAKASTFFTDIHNVY